MRKIRRKKPVRKTYIQYTKKAMTAILAAAFIYIEQSYILSFMGREVTNEELSKMIAEIVLGSFVAYCLKAFFEKKRNCTGATEEDMEDKK